MESTQNVKNSDRPLWYLTSDNSISTYLKLIWEIFWKVEKIENSANEKFSDFSSENKIIIAELIQF